MARAANDGPLQLSTENNPLIKRDGILAKLARSLSPVQDDNLLTRNGEWLVPNAIDILDKRQRRYERRKRFAEIAVGGRRMASLPPFVRGFLLNSEKDENRPGGHKTLVKIRGLTGARVATRTLSMVLGAEGLQALMEAAVDDSRPTLVQKAGAAAEYAVAVGLVEVFNRGLHQFSQFYASRFVKQTMREFRAQIIHDRLHAYGGKGMSKEELKELDRLLAQAGAELFKALDSENWSLVTNGGMVAGLAFAAPQQGPLILLGLIPQSLLLARYIRRGKAKFEEATDVVSETAKEHTNDLDEYGNTEALKIALPRGLVDEAQEVLLASLDGAIDAEIGVQKVQRRLIGTIGRVSYIAPTLLVEVGSMSEMPVSAMAPAAAAAGLAGFAVSWGADAQASFSHIALAGKYAEEVHKRTLPPPEEKDRLDWPESPDGRTTIEFQNVRVMHGKVLGPPISFKVTSGEAMLLMGENGVGKSRAQEAAVDPDQIIEGQVLFNGVPSTRIKRSELEKHVFYFPNHGKDLWALQLSQLRKRGLSDEKIKQMLQDPKGGKFDADTAERLLTGSTDDISTGQKETLGTRVVLRLIELGHLRPSVLLLDEPWSTQSFENSENGADLVRRIADLGIPTIVAAHELLTAERFSKILVVAPDRHKIAYGSPRDVLRHDGPSLAKTPEQQRYLNKIRRVTPYATLADLGILPVVRPQPAVLKLHRDTPGERGVVTFATPGQATVVVGPSPIRRELFKTLSDTSPNLSYMNGQSRWRPVQRRTGVDAGQVLYVDLQDPRALQRYLKSRQEEGLAEICETVGLGEDITPWLQEEALQNGAYKKLGTMARRLVDGLEGLSEQNRPSVVLVNNLDDVSTSRLWRMPPPDTALVVGTNDASHWQGASHLAIVNEGGIVALGATEMMLDGQPNLVRDEQAYGEWLSAATSGGNGHGLHLDFG